MYFCSVKPNLPLEGQLAINTKLNIIEKLFEDKIVGPEAFAIYNNELYTTLLNGDIIRINKKDELAKVNIVHADSEGPSRPLGKLLTSRKVIDFSCTIK